MRHSGGQRLQGTVVIAMVAMRMVQMSVHEVVDMVAVGHGGMAAAGSVNMTFFVAAALVTGGAAVGVGGVNLHDVFIHVSCVGMVQVAVVEIIDVIVVLNRQVSTTGAVLMVVICVNLAGAHSRNRIWRVESGSRDSRDPPDTPLKRHSTARISIECKWTHNYATRLQLRPEYLEGTAFLSRQATG